MDKKTTVDNLKEVRKEVTINQHALEKCHEDLENAKKSVHAKEKTLIALNKDLEEMMFTISHKVRNSVANIIAISTLIKEDETIQTGELKEMIAFIFSSAEALNKATEELSSFIRDRKSKLPTN